MNVSRGDVVLADFPYSDRTGSKVRPCLVVQCNLNNQRLDDTILVTITSRTRYAATEATQLLIEASSPAGQQGGLLFDSAVQCENIVTVDRQFLRRKIGSLPADVMELINDCLKAALDLS
ncbi:MAG: type II toxin-antitoxin system PemK/MazF family toxin [Planctomycetaceae bacterium]